MTPIHIYTSQCLAVDNLLLVYDHAVIIGKQLELIFHDIRLWLVSQFTSCPSQNHNVKCALEIYYMCALYLPNIESADSLTIKPNDDCLCSIQANKPYLQLNSMTINYLSYCTL